MNLDKSIDKLNERLNSLYPDPDLDPANEGITHWKGKPIIPAGDWKKIAITGIKGSVFKEPFLGFAPIGLQYFPDDLVELALGFEGCLVDWYAEGIYPYQDGDPRPGTDEWEKSLAPGLGPQRKLSDAELKLWKTRRKDAYAKAKKENPFGIWIEEYKELLKYKRIKLPEHTVDWFSHESSWYKRGVNGYDGKGCNQYTGCIPECEFYLTPSNPANIKKDETTANLI